MQIKLLGQGYEPKSELSVGRHLIKFLSSKEFHTFTGISAFASESGINGLSKYISAAQKHLDNITIIVGIDQKGTSKEALIALLNLKISTYIFYQPSATIFHPKIYLFEGKEKSELIIGSSNLTANGLFTNVETSLLVSVDNHLETDRKVIEQLKEYFHSIFDYTDPNLQKLSAQLIDELVRAKVVPTEAERKIAQDKTDQIEKSETESIIAKIFPKRAISKIPNEFRSRTVPKGKSGNEPPQNKKTTINKTSKLVWESGPLTKRDLNIPTGSNTNPTGSMLFKKGKTEDIDQRHYFRDTVFSSLNWKMDTTQRTSHFERAKAIFKIIVDGKDLGDFNLTISHNTKTNTKSYEQNNSMTQISWGEAKQVVASDKLIGKNASLYKISNEPDKFILKIE